MAQGADTQLADTRPRAHGLPAIFIAVLCLGAVFFALRGALSAANNFNNGAPMAATLTLFCAVVWVFGGIGLAHNGRRMRRVAWIAWTINTAVPVLSLFVTSSWLNPTNPWFAGGSTYFYLPTIGSALALVWLFWSQPARVAARNAKPAKSRFSNR